MSKSSRQPEVDLLNGEDERQDEGEDGEEELTKSKMRLSSEMDTESSTEDCNCRLCCLLLPWRLECNL